MTLVVECTVLVGKIYNRHDSDEMKQLFIDHDVLLFTETWSSD